MRLPLATSLVGFLLAGCGLVLDVSPENEAGEAGVVRRPRDARVPPDTIEPRDAADPTDGGRSDAGVVDGGVVDSGGADAVVPDDPCEDVTNWTCLIEGGGDCIAECGGWSVEIFTSSGEFVCINAPAPNLYCADPGLRNCDGCLALARDRCCFPD